MILYYKVIPQKHKQWFKKNNANVALSDDFLLGNANNVLNVGEKIVAIKRWCINIKLH
jgi:hypothetical protein